MIGEALLCKPESKSPCLLGLFRYRLLLQAANYLKGVPRQGIGSQYSSSFFPCQLQGRAEQVSLLEHSLSTNHHSRELVWVSREAVWTTMLAFRQKQDQRDCHLSGTSKPQGCSLTSQFCPLNQPWGFGQYASIVEFC